uniref:LOW QUALITY PROTEIN: helicase ARIP4-like n=1 Tax=Styela clava TaxID=7725 RepID=UPI0019394925|nr:LOW QUALITY PROTEIN: helicase ARIP4-like [Styela clava]
MNEPKKMDESELENEELKKEEMKTEGKGNKAGPSEFKPGKRERRKSSFESDEDIDDFDEEDCDVIKVSSPTEGSVGQEEIIDKGEEADSESDESIPDTKNSKKDKVEKKRSRTKKKQKMFGKDGQITGETKKRTKSQPNKRKKIRKILTEDKLQEETLKALRDEEERRKRLGLFANSERRRNREDCNTSSSLDILSATPVSEIERILSPQVSVSETMTAYETILPPVSTATPMLHQSESTGSLSSEVSRFEQLLREGPSSGQTMSIQTPQTQNNVTMPSREQTAVNLTQSSLPQPLLEKQFLVTPSDQILSSVLNISPNMQLSATQTAPKYTFPTPTPQSRESMLNAALTKSLTPSSGSISAVPNLPTVPFPTQQRFRPPAPLMRRPAAQNSSDVICISSGSSSDESSKKKSAMKRSETINISSGSESSDEVIFTGTDDNEIVEDPDVNNSGMHVNDAMNQPDHEGRVLVNKNRPPDEPEIFLASRLAKAVKPHQIGGIRFMFDNIIESLEHYKKSSGFGCILAHSMGLGKTLQVIAFIDVFLRYTGAKTALCVVPVNTLLNWVAEFEMWLPMAKTNNTSSSMQDGVEDDNSKRRQFKVRLLSEIHKTTEVRAQVISSWRAEGGVLLMGYEMFRLLTNQKLRRRRRKKTKNRPLGDVIETIDLDEEDRIAELTSEIYENLVKPGPDLIVCDEGHRIKNSHASISQALKQIATRRRIVLTGYPLQNNLLEYWCMVDFVRPNFLGTKQEFSNMFERPICNGQCADSNESDIRLMRFRSHVLHSLLKGFVQRRSHVVLKDSLPPKEEYVLMIRFSPWQKKLYNHFIKMQKESGSGSWCSSLNPIKAFSICCKIWNHPDVLYRTVVRKTIEEQQQNNDSLLDNDLDLPDAILDGVLSKKRRQKKDISNILLSDICSRSTPTTTATTNSSTNSAENGKLVQSVGFNPFGSEEKDKGINYDWAKELLHDYVPDRLELSGKMLILMQIIHHSVASGDKLLVFSQSLTTLTLIEEFLNEMNVPNPPGDSRKWRKNESYFRLDGNTNTAVRERMIQMFNAKDNNTVHLFLLSTRAGCLGINLIGANRVVVFDISWNPCHDAQAVCRVYRYGQKKKCLIYRLICDQSMEKKIYDRQISKQGMSDRVVDELNPIQSLERQDITKLLVYDDEDRPFVDLSECEKECSDMTLVSACKTYGQWFTKKPFHHESLLMDCKGSRLTKAEKRAAQKGYEQEKRAASSTNYSRPSYVSFYAAAGYPRKTKAGSKSIFAQSSTTPASGRPVANVRPIQSTPYPMRVGGSATPTDSQIIAHLQRAGINVRKTIATTDIPLPQSAAGPSTKPLVAAGDSFYMIQGTKGMYIGTTTGRIFALKSHKVDEGKSPSLVRTPGGQVITSKEHESQLIKAAFNSLLRRNTGTNQPIRYPYLPQQPIRPPYPQIGNYQSFPQQSNLLSMIAGQSDDSASLRNPQNTTPQILPNLTQMQQNSSIEQNLQLTPQNSLTNLQNLDMTQKNSMMNPQNYSTISRQSSIDQQASNQNPLISSILTQQNLMMNQLVPGANQLNAAMSQRNLNMMQQNTFPSQQNSAVNSSLSNLLNSENSMNGQQGVSIPPQDGSNMGAMNHESVAMDTDSNSSFPTVTQRNSAIEISSLADSNTTHQFNSYGMMSHQTVLGLPDSVNSQNMLLQNMSQQIANMTHENNYMSQQNYPSMSQQNLNLPNYVTESTIQQNSTLPPTFLNLISQLNGAKSDQMQNIHKLDSALSNQQTDSTTGTANQTETNDTYSSIRAMPTE